MRLSIFILVLVGCLIVWATAISLIFFPALFGYALFAGITFAIVMGGIAVYRDLV